MSASQSDDHREITTNESKPRVKEFQDEVSIVSDQQLEVLPTNEEEEKEEISLGTASVDIEPTKRRILSSKAKSSYTTRRRDEISLTEMRSQLERQTTQIEKATIMLHSIQKDIKSTKGQSKLINHLPSQIKQIQNQLSQIQKNITKKILPTVATTNPRKLLGPKRVKKKG